MPKGIRERKMGKKLFYRWSSLIISSGILKYVFTFHTEIS